MQIEQTPNFLSRCYAKQIQLEHVFTSLLRIEKAILHDPGVSTGRQGRQLSLCDSDHKLLLLYKAHTKHDAGDSDKNRQQGKRNWLHEHEAFVKAWNDHLRCFNE